MLKFIYYILDYTLSGKEQTLVDPPLNVLIVFRVLFVYLIVNHDIGICLAFRGLGI